MGNCEDGAVFGTGCGNVTVCAKGQEDVHAHTHARTHTRRLYGRAGNINGRQDADGLRASWLAEKLVCVCVFKCVFV